MLGGRSRRAARRRRAPVRLREPPLLLGVHRRARAVQRGRPVRDLRGHREAAASARAREHRHRDRHPRVRDPARAVVVPTPRSSRPTGHAAARRLWRFIRRTKDPGAAGRAPRGLRRARRADDRALRGAHGTRDRRTPLGRGRQPRDRHPPGRDRDLPRAGDGEPAARRSRIIRGHRRDERARSRHTNVCSADHPPSHRAHRPGRHRLCSQARVRAHA